MDRNELLEKKIWFPPVLKSLPFNKTLSGDFQASYEGGNYIQEDPDESVGP